MTRSHATGGLTDQRAVAGDEGFLMDGNPKVGRIAAEGFAEEAGRRHADQGEGVAFDDQGGADQGVVSAIGFAPGVVAEDGDGRGGRGIVGRGEEASAEGVDAERGEIVAGDVFGAKGLGGESGALTADTQTAAAGLKGSELCELRSFGF